MCKIPLPKAKIALRQHGLTMSQINAVIYLHPRGCMKARETHIDIIPRGRPHPLLGDLLTSRGLKFKCLLSDGVVTIDLGFGELMLSGLPLKNSAWERSHCYMFRKKDGSLYLSLPSTWVTSVGRGGLA